jgi:LmbE family N-acetylglucosaminyl deacetylase
VTTLTTAATPTWVDGVPAVRDRVVVLAPHPDDEVLGTGTLLRWLHSEGVPTMVVAVTDGEASHARSTSISPPDLRRVRADEREAALSVLGVAPALVRLGLPDGAVTHHRAALTEAIGGLVDARTTVVAPWRVDGHPDHDAVGHAATIAADHRGASLWEVSIWAKVRRPLAAAVGARHLVPDPASATAKRAAAACFRTQVHALGPTEADGPVVHPHELAALLAGPELVRTG